jgi:hypothetical protein
VGSDERGLEQTLGASQLLVEVEVARWLLLEPQALLLGSVAQEIRRLLQHILDRLSLLTEAYGQSRGVDLARAIRSFVLLV